MEYVKNSKQYDDLYDQYYKKAQQDRFVQVDPDEMEKPYGALYLYKPYFLEATHLAIPRSLVWRMYDSWKNNKDKFSEDEIQFIAYMDCYKNNL